MNMESEPSSKTMQKMKTTVFVFATMEGSPDEGSPLKRTEGYLTISDTNVNPP